MRFALGVLLAFVGALAASGQTAAALKEQLHHLKLNPGDSYRVRDLRLRRGDVTLYLNEGVLAFAEAIEGRRLAAVFTTAHTEAGDAEIVAIPTKTSERVSLASYTGSGALDEHVDAGVFFFSDDTANELLKQIQRTEIRRASELTSSLSTQFEKLMADPGTLIDDALIASLIDAHRQADGLFVAALSGRRLHGFHLIYDPLAPESVSLGRLGEAQPNGPSYQLWAAYTPQTVSRPAAAKTIQDYRLDVAIDANLRLRTKALFRYRATSTDGRVLHLSLSPRLAVQAATIDGAPMEFLQTLKLGTAVSLTGTQDASLLLVASQPLLAGRTYEVTVEYSGVMVERRPNNSFYVTDRATWYPHGETMGAEFDLTFHYPDSFDLVATGNQLAPIFNSKSVRTLHTRTAGPEQLAGFNLGQYTQSSATTDLYQVNCFAERPWTCTQNGILEQGSAVLSYYSRRWMPLSMRSLSITPIPGYFGQGFPGLIYLANLSFVPDRERPPALQDARSSAFFSRELLPHEIAHQWWGNLVTAANYRSAWLMEAMASYAALQFIEQADGAGIAHEMLDRLREDLLIEKNGHTLESFGTLDLGERLLANSGEQVWHAIVYEKGTWVVHMLRLLLGEKAFRQFQVTLLRRYALQGIDNEQVRETASEFVPAGTPDRSLKKFFDTWVYGTGIPSLKLHRSGGATTLSVEQVAYDFTADLPLRCRVAGSRPVVRWMSIVAGENTVTRAIDKETCELPSPAEYLYRR